MTSQPLYRQGRDNTRQAGRQAGIEGKERERMGRKKRKERQGKERNE